MKGLEYHILSHTHWDREWYRTFQQFRRQLVLLIDRLLNLLESDPEFKHFHLDGQTIVLEDYLALRPENEKRLANLIRAGRISVGPWYTQSDHFLTHGESTIRNLYLGHQIAKGFGKVCKVGYVPDQFGNISQLPQILRGFGIQYAVFGRGYIPGGERKAEIQWQSPDGSKVFALSLPCWYCNLLRLSSDPRQALKELGEAKDKLLPHLQTPYVLLMNGCDHIHAREDLGSIIAALNKQLSGEKVIHTRLEDYLKKAAQAAPAPTPWQGEFRENHRHQVLPGTLSARMYLKQANHRCETGLFTAETLQWVETLFGGTCDRKYLEQAWKLLLQNHAHDSICGCSLDQVHREMMPRFDQVEQIARELCRDSMARIASQLQYTLKAKEPSVGLLIFNPTAIPRSEALDVTIDIPIGEPQRSQALLKPGRAPQHISLLDEKGEPAPIHIHGSEPAVGEILTPGDLPHCIPVQRFFAQIPLEIGPLEYRSFQVVPRKGKTVRMRASLKAGNNRIENEYIQVMAGGDGSVSIRDKKTGHLYGPLLVFDDGGDVGDTYLYRCPENDRSVTTLGRPAQTRPVITSPAQGTLQIERIVTIPESADLNEQRRERTTIDCIIATRITLKDNDPTLYCETRLENKAKYHRLRVLFQSNLEAESAYADSPFDVVQRPARPPEHWQDAAWQHPLRRFVAVERGEQGLAIFTRGLHEYELANTETGTLALTLLRCVGQMSRDQDCFRWFDTPDAQCLGTHAFEFAIHVYGAPQGRTDLPRRAELFNRPLEWHSFEPQKGREARRRQLLSVEPAGVLVTAVKQCEKRDSLLVRMVNLADEAVEARMEFHAPIGEAHLLDLLETRKKKLAPQGNILTLSLKSREIATVEAVG